MASGKPSKIIQIAPGHDGAIIALDSNGNLWSGRAHTGYYSGSRYYGQSTALSSAISSQGVGPWVTGTGKLVWTKLNDD